ncbi:MAG: hypothetical protein M1517_04825, partial [Deltaproteobacteria bacterium]|nr:hypothetical protein [Deltaproteobacteria bacterium]
EMAGKLADNGFDVVGPAEILKAIESSKGYKGQALDDGAAEKIGRLSNIDVILYGSADVRLYGEVPGSEMRSARAVVSLRAVDTDNGRLLFSGEQQGASIHVDPAVAGKEALKKAVDTIADKMIATVLDEWRQEAGSGVPIRLTVDNVKLPDELAGLTSQLMSISGVRHVSEMSIGGGEAAFDVDFKGDARGLATSLLGSKALTALFDITETTRNSVRLKAK